MPTAPDNPLRLRLRVAVKLLAAAGLLAAAVVPLGYFGGGAGPAFPDQRRVEVGDLAPGQARRLDWDGRPVIVLRRGGDQGGWFVALASGTAMGCPVVWEPARARFVEPCSGARYDPEGRPIDAPGLAPLRVPPHHFEAEGRLVLGRE
ncbi:MAG: hypothetical protein R3225_04805 [Halofilum sp. (in: g-proteobacteria)]|nr:hypothetical protein [Halofilum sp. (in: g-proteobacteria)]